MHFEHLFRILINKEEELWEMELSYNFVNITIINFYADNDLTQFLDKNIYKDNCNFNKIKIKKLFHY